MLSYEETQQALTEYADALPAAVYEALNGGIVLLPDTKPHPQDIAGDLYILGEYHYDPNGLGRYIAIYYGSFRRVHGRLPPHLFRKKLKEVLVHELTHHLEHLAGDRSLEVEDAISIARYLDGKRQGP